jgi:group I intron endonuclease
MKYTTGIYQIRNTRTGDCYIGSSNNFKRRKKEHFRCLKNGKHQTRLQLAWDAAPNKSEFVFEILIVYPENGLVDLEQSCLDNLVPAYNLNPLATGMGDFYYKLNEIEQKAYSEKCSKAAERRWSKAGARDEYSRKMTIVNNRPEVTVTRCQAIVKALGRPVLNITTGEIFDTLVSARRAYNLKSGNSIRDCCVGKTHKTKVGHVWRYLDINGAIIEPHKTPKPRRTSEDRSNAMKKVHAERSPQQHAQIGKKRWETRRKIRTHA